jgi:hypothetical protein
MLTIVSDTLNLLRIYVRLKVQPDAHGFICVRYYIIFAWGCPSQYLLQQINQLLTYHNHYTYLWLYSAVCAPDGGCKQHPKHVEQIECNKEYI